MSSIQRSDSGSSLLDSDADGAGNLDKNLDENLAENLAENLDDKVLRKKLVICAMRWEARCFSRHLRGHNIKGHNIKIAVSGIGNADRIDNLVKEYKHLGFDIVISFGVATGLRKGIKASHVIIADEVIDMLGNSYRVRDHLNFKDLSRFKVWRGRLFGVDEIISSSDMKKDLGKKAIAADMESHHIARASMENGMLFSLFRVISDELGDELPRFVKSAIGGEGEIRVLSCLRSMLKRPSSIFMLGIKFIKSRRKLSLLASHIVRL